MRDTIPRPLPVPEVPPDPGTEDLFFDEGDTPDVPPSGEPSPDQDGGAFYPETTVDVRYDFDSGDVVSPVAGPAGTPANQVKLHGGGWSKVISWSFERQGEWPTCPHPSGGTDGGNAVFQHGTVVPAKPLAGPDGLRVYRVSGVYTYKLLVPLTEWGPFPTAATPDEIVPAVLNVMPSFRFDATLLQG
jgi:hypothetical protein